MIFAIDAFSPNSDVVPIRKIVYCLLIINKEGLALYWHTAIQCTYTTHCCQKKHDSDTSGHCSHLALM